MSLAYRCGECGAVPDWSITRIGDAVASWACDDHLARVCHGLQREWEQTELSVMRYRATEKRENK